MTRLYQRFKYLLMGLLTAGLFFTSAVSFGQSTTVSVTVVDSTGQFWINGTISYQFQGNGSFNGQYQWQGANLPNNYLTTTTVQLDGTGSATFTIPDNTTIVPAGSKWKFTICPNASVACGIYIQAVSGASTNISSGVTATINPISLVGTNIPKAYTDSDIQVVPATGAFYYNTTSLSARIWNGSSWGPFGGGGGGSSTVTTASPFAYSGNKTGPLADNGAGDRHVFDFRGLGDWDQPASSVTSLGVYSGAQNLTTVATYDLTLSSATFDTVNPKIGTAALNGGFAFGAPPIAAPGSSTIEAWCLMPSSAALPFLRVCAGAVGYAYIGINTNGTAYASYGNGTGTQFVNTAVTINDGNWHHLALVLSSTAGAVFYVDGVSSGTNAVTPATALVAYTPTTSPYTIALYNNNQAFQWTPGGPEAGGGEVDEPAIFNGQEYTSNFTPTTTAYTASTPNIIVAWSLDSTGISIFPLFDTSSPKFGTGDFEYGSAFAQPPIADSKNVTVEGWCKLSAVPAATEYCFGSFEFMYIGINSSGFATAEYFNGISAAAALTGATNIANGVYHHLALVTSSTGGGTLYVDGTSVASSTILPAPIYGNVFSIGSYNNTGTWAGQVDEVAIFQGSKYTANFTPPTVAYASNIPNLLALWHFDGTGASSWSGNIGNGNGYAARAFGPITNSKLDFSFQALMFWDNTQTSECLGGTLGGSNGIILIGASNQYYVCFTPAGFVSQLGGTTTTLISSLSLTKNTWYNVQFTGINANAWVSITPTLTTGVTTSSVITNSTLSKTQAQLFLLGTIPHTSNGLNNIQIQSYNSKDAFKSVRYVAGSDAAGTFNITNLPNTLNFPSFAYIQVLSGTGSGLVNTYAIVPKNYLPGEQRPWVIYNHGSLQVGAQIFTSNQNTVIDALVQNGYVVIASDYNSTTCWGNQACVQDIANEQAEYQSILNLSSSPYVIMESMGGAVTLNSIFHGTLHPKAIVGWYPVYSLGGMFFGTGGTTAFNSAIEVAYNFTLPSQYPIATAGYDPALDPIPTFSGIPMDIWCSPSDITVFCAENGQLLTTLVNAANGTATYNQSSGPHGDPSNFNPIAVVNFFNSH